MTLWQFDHVTIWRDSITAQCWHHAPILSSLVSTLSDLLFICSVSTVYSVSTVFSVSTVYSVYTMYLLSICSVYIVRKQYKWCVELGTSAINWSQLGSVSVFNWQTCGPGPGRAQLGNIKLIWGSSRFSPPTKCMFCVSHKRANCSRHV